MFESRASDILPRPPLSCLVVCRRVCARLRACVCMCVCVCVWEREKLKRELHTCYTEDRDRR